MVNKKHVALASAAGFVAAYLLIALEMKLAIRGLVRQGQKQSQQSPAKVLSAR